MSAIYRPKYKGRDGIRESAVWWVRFRQHGKTVRQSTDTDDERKTRAFLRGKEGKVANDEPVSPTGDRLTLDKAAAMIRTDYATEQNKSADTLKFRLAHLLAHFGGTMRLARISTGHVEAHRADRFATNAAPATINRELTALRRMASLASEQYGLVAPFKVKKSQERNAQGVLRGRGPGGRVCSSPARAGSPRPGRLPHRLAQV